ncbi:hypothetical protein D3C81_2159650 [compost metagenome]
MNGEQNVIINRRSMFICIPGKLNGLIGFVEVNAHSRKLAKIPERHIGFFIVQ